MAIDTTVSYSEQNIKTVEELEHIRLRPGMYIGKLGNGKHSDDGIYILLKEVLDNSIDEFVMGAGKKIEVTLADGEVCIRDYGRGIPLGSVKAAVSKLYTGGKFNSDAFQQSVGMNGVGIKAVNALSTHFKVRSFRDGQVKEVIYSCGKLVEDKEITISNKENGTELTFRPDNSLFKGYKFENEYVEIMLKNYVFLNTGLSIYLNGKRFFSKRGLVDLLENNMSSEALYTPIHFKDKDIEIVITHANQQGEEFYSFVNGQNTTQGGTHLTAFREVVARVIKDFYKKNFDYNDIRGGMVAAINIKIQEPIFESQTKIKLGSRDMEQDGPTILKFLGDYLSKELDDYLHIHSGDAEILLKKIQENERERKSLSGIKKLARDRAKKTDINNKKLFDCNIHLNNNKAKEPERTSLFITEGNSASGTIKECRDANYQAVFSLRGKPLNCFGQSKKLVYENEEFYCLQDALNIEDGLDGLRYNRIIIATDADTDGMHIRLLILTFFLQFFPELVRNGHLFILETPLFRVYLPKERKKNKSFLDKQSTKKDKKGQSKKTSEKEVTNIYCYSEEEKQEAIKKFGKTALVTRFKGLGEISPEQFKEIISEENLKLEPVRLRKEDNLKHLLNYYMGKNTPDRQDFIIDNLVIDVD